MLLLLGVGVFRAIQPAICCADERAWSASGLTQVDESRPSSASMRLRTARIAMFLPHPGFPVDIRHNAKIGREKLAAWATSRLIHGLGANA